MHRVRWITLVWPGLTQLWFAGAWWGLALACGFAWLVNVAVVSSFIWTELIDPWSRAGVWLALVAVWGGSVVLSVRHLKGFDPEAIASTSEDLFRRASREYLSGNWVAAEQLLTQLVRINPKDVDAQLMLASLLRRTNQLTEASRRLRKLETIDGAEKWRDEIKRERQLLDERLRPAEPGESEEQAAQQIEPETQPDEPPASQAA